MTMPEFTVKHPRQLTIDGSEVLSITLQIGVIRDSDHVQYQFSVIEARNGELFELAARPHVRLSEAMTELEQWISLVRNELWEATSPF